MDSKEDVFLYQLRNRPILVPFGGSKGPKGLGQNFVIASSRSGRERKSHLSKAQNRASTNMATGGQLSILGMLRASIAQGGVPP